VEKDKKATMGSSLEIRRQVSIDDAAVSASCSLKLKQGKKFIFNLSD